jgi:large subunit ribosomal protein L4
MQLDVVNNENQKVGSVDLSDDVFGGRVNSDLMWESVVHANAAARRGTHMTKNRARVSGSGKKPWRQKGTGRARVGEIRNPLWRKGGTVFGPQPRSYDFKLPKKVERGALRAALAQKAQQGELVVVDALSADAIKTKAAAELLARLGVTGKAVLIDVAVDDKLSKSVRNIPGISFVPSAKVTARAVIGAGRVVATKGAIEKLQEALA